MIDPNAFFIRRIIGVHIVRHVVVIHGAVISGRANKMKFQHHSHETVHCHSHVLESRSTSFANDGREVIVASHADFVNTIFWNITRSVNFGFTGT